MSSSNDRIDDPAAAADASAADASVPGAAPPAPSAPAANGADAANEPVDGAATVIVPAAEDGDAARLARIYETILAATDDFAYVFDREGRFLFANRRLLEVWGRTLDQVIGKTCFDLGYPAWHAEMHDAEIRHVLATKRPVRGEVPFTGASGISGVYDYIFTPVLGPDGEVEMIAGTTRDVTERKRVEEERERLLGVLENERERLRAVVELAPATMTLLRGPDLVYELVNARWHDLVGPREVLGKPLRQALPELVGQGYVELIERVYETGEPFVGNEMPVFLRRDADGPLERRIVNAIYQPLRDPDGTVSGIFAHGIDVTDLVSARESLRASEENLRRAVADAAAANAAKDRFLYVLGDALQRPLTPAVKCAAALEADPRLPVELREQVAALRRNVELEVRLIGDLLDLSRVVNGELRVERRPVRLHEVVQRALAAVRPELDAQRLAIAVDPAVPDDWVEADAGRLEQVLCNLLRNVVLHAGSDGVIRTRREADALVIDVADRGKGIAPALLARIFDPFVQGERSGAERKAGLGLGLAISKGIVELHGGSLEVASAGEGLGATFTVRLPAVVATTARAKRSREPAPTGLRVLLVEDHDDTVQTMARLLALDGCAVSTASSIAGAVALAARERFDVIVSDLGLPDGDGSELLTRLASREGATPSTVPAIALSGRGMAEDVRRSRESGFAEHLVKPVRSDDVYAAIRRVTGAG